MSTYDQILVEAFDLFAELGFEGTSVQFIAGKVGIKAASLYAHFKGKDEIFHVCLAKALRDWDDFGTKAIEQALGQASASEAATNLIMAFDGLLKTSKAYRFWTRVYVFPPEIITDAEKAAMGDVDNRFFDQLLSFSRKILPPATDGRTVLNFAVGLVSLLTGFLINAGGQPLDPMTVNSCVALLVNGAKAGPGEVSVM